jgi:hypothetical protein
MTFTPTIERGLPIPPSKFGNRKAGPAPFNLDRLEVGDSAFIPIAAYPKAVEKNGSGLAYLQTCIGARLRGHRDTKDRKFVTRRSGDGVRVWRIV